MKSLGQNVLDIKSLGSNVIKAYSLGKVVFNKNEDLPYTPIEYIKSDGSQWIDTGLPNTGDYIFEDRVMLDMITTPQGDGSWIIGGRINSSYALGVFMGSSGIFNAYGGISQMNAANFTINTWIDLYFSRTEMYTINKTNGDKRSYVVSGQKLIPETYKTNVLLGKNQVNYTNTGDDPRNMYGKRAFTKIIDATTGNVIRDYVACIDKATGQVGMWEKVENKFYGSAGTGLFIAGNLTSTMNILEQLGIEPTNDFDTNQNMINEMGVMI